MYYPKSKIIVNQQTNGNEFLYKYNNASYEGYYHILADGKVYSGKNPNDGVPRELIYQSKYLQRDTEVQDSQISPASVFKLYDLGVSKLPYDNLRLSKTRQYPPTELVEPIYTVPIPSYPSFYRYFVKRTNNTLFVEIDQKQYSKFIEKDIFYNWASYIPFQIPWTTIGGNKTQIAETNKKIVLLTEQRQNLYGLSQYITNYTEFTI